MKEDLKKTMVRMAMGLAGVGMVAVVNVPFTGMIPCHGFLLELTLPEWVVLAGVPLAAYYWTGASIPRRWWAYFGAVAYLIMWSSLSWFFFTIYHAGRRPWMPSNLGWLKAVGFLAYFMLAPVVASGLKQRRAREMKGA
jgi:hypothetical protein